MTMTWVAFDHVKSRKYVSGHLATKDMLGAALKIFFFSLKCIQLTYSITLFDRLKKGFL